MVLYVLMTQNHAYDDLRAVAMADHVTLTSNPDYFKEDIEELYQNKKVRGHRIIRINIGLTDSDRIKDLICGSITIQANVATETGTEVKATPCDPLQTIAEETSYPKLKEKLEGIENQLAQTFNIDRFKFPHLLLFRLEMMRRSRDFPETRLVQEWLQLISDPEVAGQYSRRELQKLMITDTEGHSAKPDYQHENALLNLEVQIANQYNISWQEFPSAERTRTEIMRRVLAGEIPETPGVSEWRRLMLQEG